MIKFEDVPLELNNNQQADYNVAKTYYDQLVTHIHYVREYGKLLNIPADQLVIHDLSKFSPAEFPFYAQYFHGGKRDKGSKPSKARSGSGTIVRRCVQQLEQAGYVKKIKGKGRMMTPKGQKFMDNTAFEVKSQIISNYPGLEKY